MNQELTAQRFFKNSELVKLPQWFVYSYLIKDKSAGGDLKYKLALDDRVYEDTFSEIEDMGATIILNGQNTYIIEI